MGIDMKSNIILSVAMALTPVLAGSALAQDTAPSITQDSVDAQAIQAIHERWANLIAAKDSAAIGALYADNAVLMAPGESLVEGAEAIETRWSNQLTLDGFAFRLDPEQLVISSSGDLAHDRGSYDFAATLPQGPITDTGKYVLIWQKRDGVWQVIADIFNSDPANTAK